MKNKNLWTKYKSYNSYGIPDLLPQNFRKLPDLVPCSYRDKPAYPSLVHFFIEDFRFESTWNQPSKSLDYLKQESIWSACSPDFSLFVDMPRALQIYNVFRSRLLARYWQDNGIRIIPTIQFSDSKSFDFCFLGIPKNQVLALEVPGTYSKREYLQFAQGYCSMCEILEPSRLIIFGSAIECIEDSLEFAEIPRTYYPRGHFAQKKSRERLKFNDGCIIV